MPRRTMQFVVSFTLLLLSSAGTLCAQRGAGVSGTVRNLQGTPQMGVLIELLGPTSSETAITDVSGHYQIRDILPGVYQLRATAALYLPSLRRQITVQPNHPPIVNLMMTGLFDETSWMSIGRSAGASEGDDWKWTLRSPANKPMLRLAEDAASSTLSTHEQAGTRAETHGRLGVGGAQGAFGISAKNASLIVVHRSKNRKNTVTLRSLAGEAGAGSLGSPLSLSTLLENDSAMGIQRRVSVRVRSFPQIRDSYGNSLTEMVMSSAQRMQMGDLAALEIGTETQILRAGNSTLVSHPFLRVASRPTALWTIGYAVATSSEFSHYNDVGYGDAVVPSVVPSRHGLITEAGLHQEVTARRTIGKAKVQLLYTHDVLRRTPLTGRMMGARNHPASQPPLIAVPEGVALDTTNGAFRAFAPGSATSGFGAAVDLPLSDGLTLSAGFLSGAGVTLSRHTGSANSGGFSSERCSAFLASVRGRVHKSGTRFSITYRWQPGNIVSVVAPYETSGEAPFLGVHLRQSLPAMKGLPAGVEVSVDGENLAGEAYRSYLLAGQPAVLTSALRDLRAGVSYSF